MKARARPRVRTLWIGMGNPDSPTPAHIVEKLVETVNDPRTHRYSASRAFRGYGKPLLITMNAVSTYIDPESKPSLRWVLKKGSLLLRLQLQAQGMSS